MSKHFIKEIEIKNFKCFESFEAKGFGRINLIAGKNNVGKTAFMEACFVNISAQNIDTFATALLKISAWRNISFLAEKISNFLKDITNLFANFKDLVEVNNLDKLFFQNLLISDIKTNIEHSFYQNSNDTLHFKADRFDETVELKKFNYNETFKENTFFHPSFLFQSNDLLIEKFDTLQKREREEEFIALLKEFNSDIKKFRIIDRKIELTTANGSFVLSSFGEGFRRYIEIMLDVLICENGYLFIDEIDNGIHYAKLDRLWEIILTLSKKQNVQLFATTHSKECIEAYARVAKKLEDKEISYTHLKRLSDGSIKAGVYDTQMLYSALMQEHEVRGW